MSFTIIANAVAIVLLITFIVCLFFVMPAINRIKLRHLCGVWYVTKKDRRLHQSFDIYKYIAQLGQKQNHIATLIDAFNKLESGQTYCTFTHLLPHLKAQERRKRIEIISCEKKKERFVHEYILTKGFWWYLKNRIKGDAKSNSKFYKPFYEIKFKKL